MTLPCAGEIASAGPALRHRPQGDRPALARFRRSPPAAITRRSPGHGRRAMARRVDSARRTTGAGRLSRCEDAHMASPSDSVWPPSDELLAWRPAAGPPTDTLHGSDM